MMHLEAIKARNSAKDVGAKLGRGRRDIVANAATERAYRQQILAEAVGPMHREIYVRGEPADHYADMAAVVAEEFAGLPLAALVRNTVAA